MQDIQKPEDADDEFVDMDAPCEVCGQTKRDCTITAQMTIVDVTMVQEAIKKLPPEYKDVLERLIEDWRTHALPECNPIAIS